MHAAFTPPPARARRPGPPTRRSHHHAGRAAVADPAGHPLLRLCLLQRPHRHAGTRALTPAGGAACTCTRPRRRRCSRALPAAAASPAAPTRLPARPACPATMPYIAAVVRATCRSHPVAEIMLVLWALGHLIEGASGFGTGPATLPRERPPLLAGATAGAGPATEQGCHRDGGCADLLLLAPKPARRSGRRAAPLACQPACPVPSALAPPLLARHPQPSWWRWATLASSRWCASSS